MLCLMLATTVEASTDYYELVDRTLIVQCVDEECVLTEKVGHNTFFYKIDWNLSVLGEVVWKKEGSFTYISHFYEDGYFKIGEKHYYEFL